MKKIIVVIVIIVLLIILLLKFIETSNKNDYAAKVNGIDISKTTYNKEVEKTEKFFKWAKQDIQPTSLQKDTVEKLINESLISQYAESKNITVSDEEITVRYNKVVSGFNARNKITGEKDDKFLSKIKEMYAMNKDDYLKQVEMDILKEKVQADVKMPLVKWLKAEKQKANIVIYD